MSCQPTSFKEAAKEPHWVQAMNQEIDSIVMQEHRQHIKRANVERKTAG
jgi:hypothetical protein